MPVPTDIINYYTDIKNQNAYHLPLLSAHSSLQVLLISLNPKKRTSTPLRSEKPVRRPKVPPTSPINWWISIEPFLSLSIWSQRAVSKKIWTTWGSFSIRMPGIQIVMFNCSHYLKLTQFFFGWVKLDVLDKVVSVSFVFLQGKEIISFKIIGKIIYTFLCQYICIILLLSDYMYIFFKKWILCLRFILHIGKKVFYCTTTKKTIQQKWASGWY